MSTADEHVSQKLWRSSWDLQPWRLVRDNVSFLVTSILTHIELAFYFDWWKHIKASGLLKSLDSEYFTAGKKICKVI